MFSFSPSDGERVGERGFFRGSSSPPLPGPLLPLREEREQPASFPWQLA